MQAYQERSPEAMFNLGFVLEFGAGVPKDLRLARRFYDMALHTSADAALAVYCARAWLVLHRCVGGATGQQVSGTGVRGATRGAQGKEGRGLYTLGAT